MRHASLLVALAFAFVSAACNDRGSTGNQDAAAQEDAVVQFDANLQHDVAQYDVLPQADAPPANSDSGQSLIKCGSGFCNLAAGESCCVTGTGATCVTDTGACYGTLDCDGPEDCYVTSAPVCCGTIGGTGGGASCQATCTASGAMTLCHTDETCGSGQKCCGALDAMGLSIRYCMADADCQSGPTEGVPCGSTSCSGGPADACCMSFSGGTCSTVSSCTTAGGVGMQCDGAEDCQQDGGTAQVCCAAVFFDGSALSGSAACVTTCDTTGALIGGVMCHTNDDCQSPKTCKTAGYSTFTFHLCQS